MTIEAPGHDGQSYGPYAGLCLEAQHFPDSLHNPDWPSIVCTPESPVLPAACGGDRPPPERASRPSAFWERSGCR